VNHATNFGKSVLAQLSSGTLNDRSVGYVERCVFDIAPNPGSRHQLEMTRSIDIAVNSASNENVNRSNVAINFSVFRYTDRGAGSASTDYIKLNMSVNVNTAGESQVVSVNVG
jgi:hypothetical protein